MLAYMSIHLAVSQKRQKTQFRAAFIDYVGQRKTAEYGDNSRGTCATLPHSLKKNIEDLLAGGIYSCELLFLTTFLAVALRTLFVPKKICMRYVVRICLQGNIIAISFQNI